MGQGPCLSRSLLYPWSLEKCLARGDARIQPQYQYIRTSLSLQCCCLGLRWGKFKVRTNKHMKSISPGELAPLQSVCLILISFALVHLKGGASGKAAPRVFSEKTQNKTDLRSLCVYVCVCACVRVCMCVCVVCRGGLLCFLFLLSCCQAPLSVFFSFCSSPLFSDFF